MSDHLNEKMKNKPLLSATVDIVFKKLFIENPNLLSSLLESFLPLESSIKNIEIKNPDITEILQSQAQKNSTESSESEPQSQKSSTESSEFEPQSQKSSTESSEFEPQSQKSSTESSEFEPQSQKNSTSQSSSKSSSKLEFDFENSTIYPEELDKKTVVMDLKVRLGTGESINIEVQTTNQHGFTKRILFYLAKLFTTDLQKGKDFDKIKPAYSLVFTTFPLFDEFKEHLSSFSMIRETHPHVRFSESMRIILVELPKFQKSQDIPFDFSDYWCYFLSKVGENLKKEERYILLKNKDTKMALKHLEKMSQNEVLREVALAREKNMVANALDRQGLLQEGRKEGRKEGREEKQQTIILKMIKLNYNPSDISKIVECPEDEIKKLMK